MDTEYTEPFDVFLSGSVYLRSSCPAGLNLGRAKEAPAHQLGWQRAATEDGVVHIARDSLKPQELHRRYNVTTYQKSAEVAGWLEG